LLVLALLCINLHAATYEFDRISVDFDQRLFEEEFFANQEVYKTDDYATSVFYDHPVKRFDEKSKVVVDTTSGMELPGVRNCGQTARILLSNYDGHCHLLIDACALEQYVGLNVKNAVLQIGKNDGIINVTDQIASVLSIDEYKAIGDKADILLDIPYPDSDNINLRLVIKTYLPAKTQNSLSSGHYLLYPYGTTDTLALDSNNASDYKVFLWNFVGSNTQVWNVSVSTLNGYATLRNVYSGLYLRWDLSNMDVILDSGGVVGNRFVIDDSSGAYVTIKPWLYSNRIVRYDTLSNYSNVYLTATPTTLINAEKWTLIPVTARGSAGSYRNVNSSSVNCYSYAFHISYQIGDPVPGSTSNYTVQQVANCVISDSTLSGLGISIRKLESGLDYVSYVKTNEFRVAVRIGYHAVSYSGGVLMQRDFHFMEQLSNGTWAHKPGYLLQSRNDITDPETDPWNLYYSNGTLAYPSFYDSDIIYLAVSFN